MKIIVIMLPYTQSYPPTRLESYKYRIKNSMSVFCVQFSIILRATVNIKMPVINDLQVFEKCYNHLICYKHITKGIYVSG